MKLIITKLVLDSYDHNQADRHTEGEAEDVYNRKKFMPGQVTKSNLEIISKHILFLRSLLIRIASIIGMPE